MALDSSFKQGWDGIGDWYLTSVGRNKRKDGKRNRRRQRHNLKRQAQKQIKEES